MFWRCKIICGIIFYFFLIFYLICPVVVFSEEVYKISMIPRYSPDEILKSITSLADYLTEKLKIKISPVVFINYAEFEKQMKLGNIDIGFGNAVIYVRSSKMHEAVATAVDHLGGDKVRGLIILKKQSKIESVFELRNKKICIVGKTSAAGYFSPKLYLMNKGIDIEREASIIEAVENRQENVIFSVIMGEADAGFIKEASFDSASSYIPQSKIKVLAKGELIPNDPVSVRKTMPQDLKKKIQSALLDIKPKDQIFEALKITGWKKANDSDYNGLRTAMEY
jgi:phosphonate transport system substrate-binding protein